MDAVLVDTDVFSYLMKEKHPLAAAYRQRVKGKTLALCFVTVGELLSGAKKRSWSRKSLASLEQRFKAAVIVPFDYRLCQAYAELSALKTPEGSDRIMGANDRWIAACALRHGLPLVSHNRKHFEGIPGLTLLTEAPVLKAPSNQPLPLSPPESDES